MVLSLVLLALVASLVFGFPFFFCCLFFFSLSSIGSLLFSFCSYFLSLLFILLVFKILIFNYLRPLALSSRLGDMFSFGVLKISSSAFSGDGIGM
jgi:hypothetical protein